MDFTPSIINTKFCTKNSVYYKLFSYEVEKKTSFSRTQVSFLKFFPSKNEDFESLKQELIESISPLDRGADATPEQRERVDQIARRLEAVNKVKEPLKSDLLNGKWELLYTTSQSILQTKRPKILRANGKIYQAINLDTLRAQNMETWPFFNQIPIKARGSGRGQLEITYLDEELSNAGQQRTSKLTIFLKKVLNRQYFATMNDMISRGNEGNLFILRMVDPTYRVPV
uniref:probable plastid-lipid-associated protein 4, chloroplastic isoform X2 n=1 Tax=Erigeron canadensis TaxID=72917 RepID=UPI001CB9D4A9|nr:probable plastid-lipid-associated protein 4, chloroplastic isoform X2 [Erigeron canadensis]